MGTPSSADRQALLDKWEKRQPYWFNNPALFIREVIDDGEPWSRQLEILDAIAKYDEINVASGHAIGKDWLVARVVIWWLLTRRNSVVLTTAPTKRQVHRVLWGQIRRAWRASKLISAVFADTILPVESEIRFSESWYAQGFVGKEANSLQGFHSDGGGVLIVIDEAAGIPDWAFESIEGCATGAGSKTIRIGNPTVPTPLHPFARAFRDTDPLVKNLQISSLDTPNYQQKRTVIRGLFEEKDEKRLAKKFGRGSDAYKARVLGRFPSGSSDSLITPEHIAAARERSNESKRDPTFLARLIADSTVIKRIGVDVARFGDDRTCFAVLVGDYAFIPSNGFLDKADGTKVARHAAALVRQYNASSIAIDGGGLGGGAVDALVELQRREELPSSVQLFDVEFGGKSSDPGEWANKRTELHWRLRDWMWETGALDPDVDTEEELLAASYKVAARGSASILEPKDKIKARLGGRSPDRSDALALAVSGWQGKVQQRGPLVLHWW